MRIVALVLLLSTAARAAGDGGAPATGAAERFEQALDLAAADPARAADALEELASSSSDGEYVPDALVKAAEIREEQLGQPDRALALYDRLLTGFPEDRLALRARARREFLAANLGAGPRALAEYQDILLRYASRPPEESAARMERLLVAHPEFALAGRARLWLAEHAARRGLVDEAERRYLDVERRAPGSSLAAEAARGRGRLLLEAGRVLEARRVFTELTRHREPNFVAAGKMGLKLSRRALLLLALRWAALLYLLAFLAVEVRAARGGLARFPLELAFYLPVAALLFLASLGGDGRMTWTMAMIAAGGALVVWASAVATRRRLERGPLGTGRRVVLIVAASLAVLSVAYAAIHLTRATEVIIETITYGPEQ